MVGELILLVDDEPNIVALAEMYLKREGYRIASADDGLTALDAISAFKPAIIILDIMLPQLDGLEVCRRLRADQNPVPILLLTAKDDDIDKIVGLEIGADDYMIKPFNPRELVARVKAVLRRSALSSRESVSTIHIGNLTIDSGSREISVDGKRIIARNQEFDLLLTMVKNRGLVLTREQLLEQAWDFDFAGQTRTVDVHVGLLRKKLTGSSVHIETVTGVGYKLVVD
jgi:DNA-binding response OmpR family regulator